MKKVIVALLILSGGLCVTPSAWCFIQERTPSGAPLRWNLTASQPNISGGKVVYLINKRGSDDVAFATLATAVDGAFATWRFANGSVIDFLRITDPSTGVNGTVPSRKDQQNVVFWDEDPRNGSMIPGLTFGVVLRDVNFTTGEILDADIIVNAFQFLWTGQADGNFTSLTGPHDVQATVTNAVGQFIGLNLVPTMGNVLEEFDYPGDTTRRILTPDELAAALDIYPPSPNPAVTSISGQVTRSGSPVFGAYVAAFQGGVAVVGAITNASGNYSIKRVPTGNPTYTVRVVTAKPPPGSSFYSALDNNFLSQVYLNSSIDPPATPVTVTAGADTPGIVFGVAAANTADPWEPDNSTGTATPITTTGSRQIHHISPAGESDFVKFSATVGHVYMVETSNLGVGASSSDTTLTLTGEPGTLTNDERDAKQKSRTSRIAFRAMTAGDHFVQIAQVNPAVGGSGTAYDISVTDLGVTFPAPVVSAVTPTQGSQGGGYQVTLTGANFVPGASVAFGPTAGTEVNVVSSTKLFVTVPLSASSGAVSVTVTNPDGASGVLASGFTYTADITQSFVDATLAAFAIFPTMNDAVAWADYDKDRDLDFYFATDLAAQLFRNNGNATFTNVSAASGIAAADNMNPESVAWGDYNNDGCVDVYKVNLQVTANKVLLKNNCDGTFTNITATAGVAGRTNGRSRDAAWADFNNDGFLDLFVAYDDLAGPNQLFRNNKDGTFTDVAASASVNNTGSGFNVNWGDCDNDGWPDLFLVRSGAQSDILYRNNRNSTFTDVTSTSGIVDTAQGTDVVWGDFNNDGLLDLYVVGSTGINHLFKNTGNCTFTDISTASSTGDSFGSAKATTVGDFDNDGRLDIFVAQAFDGRTNSQVDFLFHNDGGDPPTFSDATFTAGVGDSFNGLTAAFGDYTGDGAPDLAVGNSGSSNGVLWRNQANRNNWLVVRLVGTTSNRLGVGVRVSATADLDGNAGTPSVTQTREVIGGSKGQSPIEADLGLGKTMAETRKVDSLTVLWPASGTTQTFLNLAVNQIITVFEGQVGIVVTGVAPSSGPIAGGTTAVVSGENFDGDATVQFGGASASIVSRSGTNAITVTTPAQAAGLVDVTVTNPSKPLGDPLRQATLPKGFLYFSGDPLANLVVFDEVNTTLMWGAMSGATGYDAIRGNVDNLMISGSQVSLGSVLCLENDSPDTTTAPANRDAAVPALGSKGFFYVVRVTGGSYGMSSAGFTRVPTAGDCP